MVFRNHMADEEVLDAQENKAKKERAALKAAQMNQQGPESTLNKPFLVTSHYGNRAHVVYHGTDEVKAAEITNSVSGGKREAGQIRQIRKMWVLRSSVREKE